MPIHHHKHGAIPTDTERTFVALADEELGTQCSVHENILNPNAVVPWHQHASRRSLFASLALVSALSRAKRRRNTEAASW